MNDSVRPKFVTCKYTGLHGTKQCGRLNREYEYMYSLRGIAECGDTIINYTQKYDMDIHVPYFEKEGIKNVIDVEYDLISSPYHARVDAIKDKHPEYYNATAWIHRNVLVMMGKFLWMELELQKMDDDEVLYWIDSGLSHGRILDDARFSTHYGHPEYYREEKPEELKLEYAHRHDIIFNKNFFKRLEKFTGDRLMFITVNNDQHGDPMNGIEYYNHLRQWPIGGLWGGKKSVLMPFINRFKELADIVLAHDTLVKEEQIMSKILNEGEELLKHDTLKNVYYNDKYITYLFATWYHEGWNVNQTSSIIYNTDLVSFCSFFDMLNQIKID